MSINAAKAALLCVAAISATACATKDSYMGLDKEKAYETELNVKRLTEVNNNDDYYELHKDNTIFVFTDAKSYKLWLATDEIPLAVTKFRVGPNGERAKFQLSKNDSKAMEGKVGYKGASQKMYEGELEGLAKDFISFIYIDANNTFYVFDNWAAVKAFKASGTASGFTDDNGPKGSKVVYVGAASKPAAISEKFAKLHDGK